LDPVSRRSRELYDDPEARKAVAGKISEKE